VVLGAGGRRVYFAVSYDVQVREVPESLLEIEAVADEELVGHREADVGDGELVDEAPVRTVEERHGCERAGAPEPERPCEVVERQSRIDHVLDEQEVAAADLGVEILQPADR
jgi:hypothetical protein